MSEQTQAVTFVGLDGKGGPIFEIIIGIPDCCSSDSLCTERQFEAVKNFYCNDFAGELTYSQAHKLLSYRQYARECADHMFSDDHPRAVQLFARLIAAYICSNPAIAAYAVQRSNRRFHAGTDTAYVTRTKFFYEVATFCDRIKAELIQHRAVF